MIFHGIRISIAKKPYIFVIFQGGPDPQPPPPLDPRMQYLDDHYRYYTFINPLYSIEKIYYSNFDKHALNLSLWHSITFDFFSSNSTIFAVVIENADGYSFLCKSFRRYHGCLLVGKCKILFLTEKCTIFKSITYHISYKWIVKRILKNKDVFLKQNFCF